MFSFNFVKRRRYEVFFVTCRFGGDVATLEKVQRRVARFSRKRPLQKRIQCHANDVRSRMVEPRSAQGFQLLTPDV